MVASLLFAAGALVAGYLYHRPGGTRLSAGLFVLVLFFGSAALFATLTPRLDQLLPETAVSLAALPLVASALLLLFSGERSLDGAADKVYGEIDQRRVAAFLFVMFAAKFNLVCLPLWVAVLAAAPRAERRGATWKILLGTGLAATGALAAVAGHRLWTAPQEAVAHLDPLLLMWSSVDLVAGRSFGLVVWYLPALLLIACYRRGSGRGWLLLSIAIGALGLVIASPYDLRGVDGFQLNASFLPLYGALWFVPTRVPKMLWIGLTAIAAGLFLWPAWLSPLDTAAGEDRPSLHEHSLASRLPYETTQEGAPYTAEWQGTGVLSRALGPGLEDGDRGPALVPSAGPAHLMIAAAKPLEAVLLDFGREAATELRVEGGTTGNTVFQPNGGVRFEIVLDAPDRSHPMWFSPKRHYIYLLEIEMPNAPAGPLPVAIMARPKDALPRSLDPASAGKEL